MLAFYSTLGESHVMAKVDIKGAFVQTPMEGKPVYMRIDKKVTWYIVAVSFACQVCAAGW